MLELNQPAPDFSLPDLKGTFHNLGDYQGRLTLLNFWSAECPHAARVDAGLIADLHSWNSRATLIAIASNVNESPEQILQASTTRGIPLVLVDGQGDVADLYSAVTTPHFFLIDADGLLRYRGSYDDITFRKRTATHYYLRQAVQALMDGQSPDPADTPPYGCSIVRHFP